MQLLAGQRIILEGDDKFARVLSGKIEVYAITRGKVSYRQFYLMKIGAGEAIFPTMDDFGELAILIYAIEDSELMPAYFAQSEPENLSALMKKWFAGLEKISWSQLLADQGDEILISWRRGTILKNNSDWKH